MINSAYCAAEYGGLLLRLSALHRRVEWGGSMGELMYRSRPGDGCESRMYQLETL